MEIFSITNTKGNRHLRNWFMFQTCPIWIYKTLQVDFFHWPSLYFLSKCVLSSWDFSIHVHYQEKSLHITCFFKIRLLGGIKIVRNLSGHSSFFSLFSFSSNLTEGTYPRKKRLIQKDPDKYISRVGKDAHHLLYFKDAGRDGHY